MNGPGADPELQALFLEMTKKFAAITAELGVPGDEPIEKILACVRRLKAGSVAKAFPDRAPTAADKAAIASQAGVHLAPNGGA